MPALTIPLDGSPNQSFQVAVNVNGALITLNLTIRYSYMAGHWIMTIKDGNQQYLLDSVPLLTGSWPAANILGQYVYLGIGSAQIINAGNNICDDYPTDLSLGTDFILVWDDAPAA